MRRGWNWYPAKAAVSRPVTFPQLRRAGGLTTLA